MVMDWGMSESMGLRTHDGSNKSLITVNDLSPVTMESVDNEIKKILQVRSSNVEKVVAIVNLVKCVTKSQVSSTRIESRHHQACFMCGNFQVAVTYYCIAVRLD